MEANALFRPGDDEGAQLRRFCQQRVTVCAGQLGERLAPDSSGRHLTDGDVMRRRVRQRARMGLRPAFGEQVAEFTAGARLIIQQPLTRCTVLRIRFSRTT
jgi:hypothetical protein